MRGVTYLKSNALYTDNVDADGNTVAAFLSRRVWNYGKAGYDRTHNLVLNYTWDLPKLRRIWNHGATRTVFDNWQLAGIVSFISGAPLGIGLGAVDGADITGGGDARVVVLDKAMIPKSERTLQRFFDTSVFARPAQGATGNAPKDVIRGPGINNWDPSIFKHFPIRDRAAFQLRWGMYNAFNHTQFEGVDTSTRFDAGGRQTNARFGALTSGRDARRMQGCYGLLFEENDRECTHEPQFRSRWSVSRRGGDSGPVAEYLPITLRV